VAGEKLTKDEFIKQQNSLFAKMSLAKAKRAISAENTPLLMLEVPSNYTRAFLYTGDYLVSEYHDYKTAQIYYQKAYELNPNELDSLKSMIMSQVMLGECQKAEVLVRKLVELNGDKAKIFQIAVKDPKICKPHR
jgi:tetratricopeptide (TPR) repeat protein